MVVGRFDRFAEAGGTLNASMEFSPRFSGYTYGAPVTPTVALVIGSLISVHAFPMSSELRPWRKPWHEIKVDYRRDTARFSPIRKEKGEGHTAPSRKFEFG